MVEPTEEQLAIVKEAKHGSGSLLIPAYAGAAKTTSLALAGRGIKCPALGLVFNKRNQEEMKSKFAGNFSIRTPHSLGFLAWTRANPQVGKWEVVDRKLGKLVSQAVKERKLELAQDQYSGLREMVRWAMILGLVPAFAGEGLVSDDALGWGLCGEAAGLASEDTAMLMETAQEVLQNSIVQARQGVLSFDEMVYCSALLGGSFPKYPLIMTDETQDLGELNLRQVAKALKPDGRLIAVGDGKQGIYAWRGASQGMDAIQGLRPEGSWTSLPLTMTFRCPKVIVARQQAHAPGFRAAAANKEGRWRRWHWDPEALDPGWTWSEVENMRPASGTLAVLCRNNAPLLKLAFRLIRQRVGVEVLGRDISGGLVTLSRKLGPEDQMPSPAFAAKLLEWQDHEEALAQANEQGQKAETVRDKAECLRACLDDAEVRTVGELRRVLEMLFARRGGQVILSTVHKAKGLEWDLVLHLDPWRIPSRQARERGGLALEQEWNLLYVCETRTKEVLVEADLDGFSRN